MSKKDIHGEPEHYEKPKQKKWWQKEWDPIGNLVAKVSKSGTALPETAPDKAGEQKEPQESAPDMKELEKKGLLGKFYRHWKDPAFKKQLQAVAERMKADGVDVKNQNAVKAWVQAHQKEIESGKIQSPTTSQVKTFVKDKPSVGRNEPCPCGSKKKYKKCCARN
ncbi:MAG: SEC-C metal-binding domain-containing protein [Elusimicrobiota bacterium]